VMPGTVDTKLVNAQKAEKAGVFACDQHAILQAAAKPDGEGKKMTAATLVPKIFKQIWDEVHKNGKYLLHDWTVKVDPDSVFIPSRLRVHLKKLIIPKGEQIYIKNVALTENNHGFLRPIEVFSREALKVYFEKKTICEDEENKMRGFSEAFYLMSCMDVIGVHHMVDVHLLYDQYTDKGKRDVDDTDRCRDDRYVAFHPYEQVQNWNQCYKNAKAV